MSKVIDTFIHDGMTVEILPYEGDIENLNPRHDDCFCVIVADHPKYEIGDTEHGYRPENGYTWGPGSLQEVHDDIVRTHKDCLIKPLYLMDHGMIGVSLRHYGDKWDSGQVGWVFVSRQMIRDNWGIKRVTKEYLAKAEALMASEVEEYGRWLEGSVYIFRVTNPATGESEKGDPMIGMYSTQLEAFMTARSMYLTGVNIEGAANYSKREVGGKPAWHVSPFYTVADERAEQWEAECEGIRAQVRDKLHHRAYVTCVSIDFDENAHSMFVNLASTNEHVLKFVLKELSEIGFCTGVF